MPVSSSHFYQILLDSSLQEIPFDYLGHLFFFDERDGRKINFLFTPTIKGEISSGISIPPIGISFSCFMSFSLSDSSLISSLYISSRSTSSSIISVFSSL
eukprot:GHVR01011567.1.p1 GENE.GHVR01011567.1~~GHVR01011567.1.p1  ORF type:complete len:100 (+),score=2.79 GHVR01011567.1:125-424(+)